MAKLDPMFSSADVKVQQRSTSYDGFLRIDELLLSHRLIEGGWSEIIKRELQIKAGAVAILMFDPVREEVVLVRQFRVGMIDEQGSPWLLEIVAGMIEMGETPEDVAIRESIEEADLTPANILKICEYYSSPGTTNEKVYLYCGQVDSSNAGGVHGMIDEHEDIEVVVISFAELVDAVECGLINNAMTIIATQWLEKNMPKVLAQWQVDG
ncbi:MAG: ADP-ribose pyrophosphatase [Pseudohongiellaceae bacterium]